MINCLSLLFQSQLCRGLSGKLIKFLPKLAFGPYIWVEPVDNVTCTVGNVSVSISEQSELLSTAIPAFLAWFLLTIGAFSCNALDFFIFSVSFGPYLTMWIPVSSSPFLLQPCSALWRVSWCSSQSSFHPGFSRVAHVGNCDRCKNLSSDWNLTDMKKGARI